MEPPEHFEDGFTWKTIVGAVFLGMLIMPGSMYLSLVVGPEANMDTTLVLPMPATGGSSGGAVCVVIRS